MQSFTAILPGAGLQKKNFKTKLQKKSHKGDASPLPHALAIVGHDGVTMAGLTRLSILTQQTNGYSGYSPAVQTHTAGSYTAKRTRFTIVTRWSLAVPADSYFSRCVS